MLDKLPEAYVDLIVTAPPQERQTPEFTCAWLAASRRVLKPQASVAVVMADTSAWWTETLHACQGEGWHLTDDIRWIKDDAPSAPETVFVLARTARPYVNLERYAETFGARRRGTIRASLAEIDRSHISSKCNPAQFPVRVPEAIIRTYSGRRGVVLDPFMGAGNTAVAARTAGRSFVGIERDGNAINIARARLKRMRTADEERTWTPATGNPIVPLPG